MRRFAKIFQIRRRQIVFDIVPGQIGVDDRVDPRGNGRFRFPRFAILWFHKAHLGVSVRKNGTGMRAPAAGVHPWASGTAPAGKEAGLLRMHVQIIHFPVE